jgi:hypothetical protein
VSVKTFIVIRLLENTGIVKCSKNQYNYSEFSELINSGFYADSKAPARKSAALRAMAETSVKAIFSMENMQ